ncbi:riboflavin synthase [candidate division WOR-3 bacterium]|uniref:Riboflavin synthase n=1 Tax=candidate division WOR-3 bacterium TaxID=2052148 RepID=A0A9D5KAH7_UNCW3|nr:riboflavin synthase [candidate division WOR-3 bacterium]MBD3365105.1 riboflavin synthase [candidate division WOR-3 bacterium]
MFTGLIEETGVIRGVLTRGANKIIEVSTSLETARGDSLCVNGVCLTVIESREGTTKVGATAETIKRTTLSVLHPASRINLERALTLNKPLGGHLVQGHVDEVGKVSGVRKGTDAWRIGVTFSRKYADLVVDQGSVAVDGVSLTVLEKVPGPKLVVNVIPETLKRTTLSELRASDKVNLEFDLIAKYVREQVR